MFYTSKMPNAIREKFHACARYQDYHKHKTQHGNEGWATNPKKSECLGDTYREKIGRTRHSSQRQSWLSSHYIVIVSFIDFRMFMNCHIIQLLNLYIVLPTLYN